MEEPSDRKQSDPLRPRNLEAAGYLPFSASAARCLFHLLSKLYERTASFITTNSASSEVASVLVT